LGSGDAQSDVELRMEADTINILLVESDPVVAARLLEDFEDCSPYRVEAVHARSLGEAIKPAEAGCFDIIFANLELEDSRGFATLERLLRMKSVPPVVAMVPEAHEMAGQEALNRGATDYIVTTQAGPSLLTRVLRYALERRRMQETLRSFSLIDDLTGFYNLNGFSTLVDYQMKLARRTLKRAFLSRIQLANHAEIRDGFGDREAETALKAIAEMLRVTFRATDILARIATDEFACYVYDVAGGSTQSIMARLKRNVDTFNKLCQGPYSLEVRIGITRIYADDSVPVDELLIQAGESMKAPDQIRLVT
jgi:diguanylate cyclase (GGDEF)-like protein